MKNIYKILIFIITVGLLTGCSLEKDNLDGATIYVTNYPIKYLVQTLYKNHGNIESIYPNDADTTTYKVTDKQIKTYSKGDVFVYNGLTDEKELAKSFLNSNKNILIMDVSYGLSIKNSTEELWLSPNNYLMLAKNIKDNFDESLTNKYIIKEVDENYETFAEKMSLMDADIRSIGQTATNNNKNTLVVESKSYEYLSNYGFNIICLDNEAYSSDEGLKIIKTNFKAGKYLALISNPDNDNKNITDLVNNYKAKNVKLSTMTKGISSDDYISTMQAFIDELQSTLSN